MMTKVLHMNGFQAQKVLICHLIFLLASLNSVWAGILIYDGSLGIEEFRDVELSNTEPISKDGILGAIVAASPIDACSNISRPPNVNISMNWFVLIAGNSCSFEVKVLNARYAGYAVAVIYITDTRVPHFIRTDNGYYSFFPNISAVVIGSDQGRRIRDNYLFEIDERFRVYIFPNNSFSMMTFLLLFSIVTGLFLIVMLVFAVIRFFQHSSSAQRGRLSSRHLKQLQTSTYQKGDGSDSCAICLEEYKDQDKLRFLPCSHGYHARCIDPWLTNNRPICPVCKQKVVLEGHSSDNNRDSDFDERSETTPLLQDRRDTQHGTFNLIYNPEGENVGDINLPSTSVSENVGRVRVLRKSVSGPGRGDSSNNSVTENLSGDNLSKDSAPQNVGIIKRLVFLKNSPKTVGSSDVSIPSTSNNSNVSAEPVVDFSDTNLPGDSAVINITGVDLPKSSVAGIGLLSNSGSTNIGDGVSSVLENLSSDPSVANVGSIGINLPGDTMTGYVAGSNLSEFWPSDHLDKIKVSNDSLSRNQDGSNLSGDVSVNLGVANLSGDASENLGVTNLSGDTSVNLGGVNLSGDTSVNLGGVNLSGDTSVNLGGANLSGDAKVNLGGGNASSISGAIGDINLSTQSMSVNLDESVVGNLGVTAPSDLNRTSLGGIIAAVDSAASNKEPFKISSGSVATNLGVSVSSDLAPRNPGIDLPGESVSANLGDTLSSGVSVSANLGGVNVTSPSIGANIGGVNVSSPSIGASIGGVNVTSPSIGANIGSVKVSSPSSSAKLGGMNVSSPAISANLGGVGVSSPSLSANLGGVGVSSPSMRANLGSVGVSSPSLSANLGSVGVSRPSMSTNLGGVGVSSPSLSANLGGVGVSRPSLSANLGGVGVSSPSVSAHLGGVSVSSPTLSANLGGVGVSSPSLSANPGDVNVSSPLVAASENVISVSSPSVHSNLRSSNLPRPSLTTSLGGINVSLDTGPANLGISSASATAAPSEASLSNKPVAANRRRRRK